MASNLKHLILEVRDMDRSLEFYHGMLHLRIRREDAWEGHRLAYLTTGGTELLLVQQPLHEQNPLLDRSGGLVINFRVTDVKHMALRMRQQEVLVLRDLEMAVWGERTILVADPDGYAVLLSEPVESLN